METENDFFEMLNKWHNYYFKKRGECSDNCDDTIKAGDCGQYCSDLILLIYLKDGKIPPHIRDEISGE